MRRLVGPIISLMICAQATADEGRTTAAKVFPAFDGGVLTGCQLAFRVLRSDDERGGQLVTADGLILFTPAQGVTIRLGIENAQGVSIAPMQAYLVQGFESNSQDFVRSAASSEPGKRLFIFRLGDRTADAIARSAASGIVEIIYRMKADKIDSRLVATTASDVASDWRQCIAKAIEVANR